MRFLAVCLALCGLAACQSAPQPPSNVSAPVVPLGPSPEDFENGVTFAFEPFTGAPGNLADDLSGFIGAEARQQGLTLVRRVGAMATYRVSGYLSATGQPSTATVFYVFDISDSSGNRQTRISGTETISGSVGDPWQAVSSGTLQRIANRSVVEIKAWVNR